MEPAADPPSSGHRLERAPRTWLLTIDEGADPVAALAAASAEVAAGGGGDVRWWTTEPGPADVEAATAAGFHAERELHQLRRPLPLRLPGSEVTGFAVRPFRPGIDDEAFLAVNNRAFDWHPEQGGWTAATLAGRIAEPWFDPEGFLLHDDPATGRLAGFVWTKVHPPTAVDPAMGEIYVIATDPDFAGHGLGRRLTSAGLDHLHRLDHVAVGMLYVDGGNEAALGLYEKLGFERHHTDVAFLRTVAATP